MKKLILPVFLAWMLLFSASCGTKAKPAGTATPSVSIDSIKTVHYTPKSFRRSVSKAEVQAPQNFSFQGGICPHHLLADDLIASFFKSATGTKPDLVFIIAPNHKNEGISKIHTCLSSWETPYGLLHTETTLVKQFVIEQQADLDAALMEKEHSISSLIPYIKYYWPDCQVIPLLLHGNMSLDNCISLGQDIAKKAQNKKAFILASIDFSHYLSLDTADKMDEITLKAIKSRNLKQIRQMGNDNMDSPSTMITFLSAMTALNADEMTQLGHSNSDRIAGADSGNTTSYFTMLFH